MHGTSLLLHKVCGAVSLTKGSIKALSLSNLVLGAVIEHKITATRYATFSRYGLEDGVELVKGLHRPF